MLKMFRSSEYLEELLGDPSPPPALLNGDEAHDCELLAEYSAAKRVDSDAADQVAQAKALLKVAEGLKTQSSACLSKAKRDLKGKIFGD
jgi:hypothetical protein